MLAAVTREESAPTAGPPREADVSLAAGGDREAFARVYRAHVARVHALCTRMSGDRARAEELTQDVFVRTWEKLPLFRGESAFSTWLHRLAVNVILSARESDARDRARHTTQGASDTDDGLAARARTPRHADRLDLEAAIVLLPPGARRVFVLHDVEGFKHHEIAEMLGVTTGGCKAQLHRARLLLREALTR